MNQATQDMLDALREQNFGSAQVALIMGEVRKQLESREEWAGKFNVLRFYCNWCLHSQIDRNPYCKTIIKELNQCLWQLDESGNADTTGPMNIAGFLRISQLCNELGYVIAAISGDIVYPTLTFVRALFTYLKGVSVVPVDTVGGSLDRTKSAFATLCQELQIDPNRPLLKNFMVTDVDDTCLQYDAEMDNTEQIVIHSVVNLPLCSEPPFIFAAERQNENKFAALVNKANQLFLNKQLDDAWSRLGEAMALLPNVQGMDELKAQMYLLLMEVCWARSGDVMMLEYGEKAMDYIADPIQCSTIYCQMGEYALQRISDVPDALPIAKGYIEKSLELAPSSQFKVKPLFIKGQLLLVSNQPDDALSAYTEAAQYAEETHMEAMQARIRCDIAALMEKQGYPEMALSELTHAENVAKSSADPIVITSCMLYKAQFLNRQRDDDTACRLIASMPKMI